MPGRKNVKTVKTPEQGTSLTFGACSRQANKFKARHFWRKGQRLLSSGLFSIQSEREDFLKIDASVLQDERMRREQRIRHLSPGFRWYFATYVEGILVTSGLMREKGSLTSILRDVLSWGTCVKAQKTHLAFT